MERRDFSEDNSVNEYDPHTISEKLLLAAAELSARRSPFPIQALIMTAWQRWPETFGLTDYEQTHPNANIIISAMSGKKGMVGRGCFTKVCPNIYRLSQMGLDCIKWLKEGNGSLKHKNAYKQKPGGLKGKWQKLLVSILKDTVAYIADCAGRRISIDFVDAQRFFNGHDRKEVLRQLTEISESDRPEASEARVLRGLADHLCERFAKAWDVYEKDTAKS